MTRAGSVHSMPPLRTSVPERPRRPPTSQERADELLMRWRLARAAGIPADRRHGGRSMKDQSLSLFAAALLVFVGISIGLAATDALDDAIVRNCIVRSIRWLN
jgi:hypothetical protein